MYLIELVGLVVCVAFEISNAFDKVWHAGLLHKFKFYGLLGQIFGLCLFSVVDSFEWLWMGSLLKNIQLMLEFQGSV